MGIRFRDWQEEAYDEFKKYNFKGIIKVGTGKGKTVFAIYCIQKFLKENSDFRTCIIVPTINLMFQWKKEIINFLNTKLYFCCSIKWQTLGKWCEVCLQSTLTLYL